MAAIDETMARVRDGSETALKYLVGGWRHVLEDLAYRLLYDRGDSADVVQETFIALWEKRENYTPDRPAWPWIVRILRNKCCDRWRRRGSRRGEGIAVCESVDCAGCISSPGVPADRAYENRERVALARQRLERLSPTLREVVQLALFSDMTDAAIAEALGIPLGTVKSRKHRGLALLRRDFDNLRSAPGD